MSNDILPRMSRYSRSNQLAPIILQDRDKKIITACYQFRFLLRTQIQSLFDMPCVTRVNLRLRKLFDYAYLDREFLPTNRGGSEALYLLGRNGITIVSEEMGLDPQIVRARRTRDFSIASRVLEHDIQVNNARISIINEIQRDPRFTIKRWLDASEAECRYERSFRGRSGKTSLRPDGFLQVDFAGRVYSFFVEIDLSTSNHRKLEAKFHGYSEFKTLALTERFFGIRHFNVLVLTKSPQRRDNLKQIADLIESGLFWFSTNTELVSKPLTSCCWYRSGEIQARALFQSGLNVSSP